MQHNDFGFVGPVVQQVGTNGLKVAALQETMGIAADGVKKSLTELAGNIAEGSKVEKLIARIGEIRNAAAPVSKQGLAPQELVATASTVKRGAPRPGLTL